MRWELLSPPSKGNRPIRQFRMILLQRYSLITMRVSGKLKDSPLALPTCIEINKIRKLRKMFNQV